MSYLVQIDQSGAEALIVAYLTKHGNFRELFLNNIKPHVFVAMHLVPEYWSEQMHEDILPFLKSSVRSLRNVPRWKELEKLIKDSDNSKDPSKRYYHIGKTVCHASNYDMKAPTMQMQALDKSEGELRLTYEFCKHSLELYKLRLFPEIPAWHIEIQDELRYNKKILRNLFGYPREFNKTLGEDMYKEAYAYKPQSTVGTITNIAATEIQQGIDNGDYSRVDVLNNNHDSLLLQLHYTYDECLKLIPLLQSHFNRQLMSPRGEIFYMKSSASIGKNWAPYDEKDNPEGLKEI